MERRSSGWGRGFHTHTLGFRRPQPGLPVSGRHLEFICLQADYVSSSLLSRSQDPPTGFFPPPSDSEYACVTMVRFFDWLELAVTSSYATSFPRCYKKCCTVLVPLRPSELEMQLSGSSEAAELEAEAAGEVRAM